MSFYAPRDRFFCRLNLKKDHEETAEEADILQMARDRRCRCSRWEPAVKAVAEKLQNAGGICICICVSQKVTKLTEVRGASANLPSKLDAQFGWSQKE